MLQATEVACFATVAEQRPLLVLMLSGLTDAQSVPDVLDLAHYISLSNSFMCSFQTKVRAQPYAMG